VRAVVAVRNTKPLDYPPVANACPTYPLGVVPPFSVARMY